MNWNTIYSAEELDAYFASIAKLDPAFAAKSKAYWEVRGAGPLKGMIHGAWMANDLETYVIAKSYLALKEQAERERQAAMVKEMIAAGQYSRDFN